MATNAAPAPVCYLQAYEQQLVVLGVPLPGPYGAGGQGQLLAAAEGADGLPQGEAAAAQNPALDLSRAVLPAQ